ncbi:MAG: FAD-binding domain-containing protein [Pseudomonadota bacterium]
MTDKRAPQLVWFKRDLRVQDHAPLVHATEAGPVLPVYVVEPDLWAQPDVSGRQFAFLGETLDELRRDLSQLGAPLILRIGDVIEEFQKLHAATGFAAIWSHEETGNGWTFDRDKRVAAWARNEGVAFHELPQGGVVRRLKTRNGWAKRWDAFMGDTQLPPPSLTPVKASERLTLDHIPLADEIGLAPDPCPDRQAGGRTSALACLESFLTERGAPYRKAMSAPEPGARHCSRLSPHLAFGSISMRETAQALWARQRELKDSNEPTGPWRGSMTSFSGRLHWRHHFMQKLEDEPRLEFENLHPGYDGLRPATPDTERLSTFANGETGLPFVDACMRCLAATGWMNFRMRAMLQAVASYHLWLPWRDSGLVLARLFTDYEPGIHWSQVQMQSGTTGINTVRIYNPVKQGHDQDPDGSFTRRWVPELTNVPDKFLQEPWKWEEADTLLGRIYPEPIVDPVVAARIAKEKVYGVRRSEAFRHGANAIQEKHGSRKSGIPVRGQRRKKAGSATRKSRRKNGSPPDNQLNLDL